MRPIERGRWWSGWDGIAWLVFERPSGMRYHVHPGWLGK